MERVVAGHHVADVGVGLPAHPVDEESEEPAQERAASVVEHLVKHGVDPLRLVPVGHGKNHPIASNKTEAGRSQNRRVEFRMTVKGEDQAQQKTR